MQPFLVMWNCSKQFTTSTTHLDQELPTDVQCGGGSRSFAEETRVLKMRSVAAGHWKLTKRLRGSSKPILLQLHEEMLKNSISTIQQSCGIWSKLERWKSSISGCLMSWPQIKNIVFSYPTQKQLTVSRLDCDVLAEWTLCDNQLSCWTKKRLQSASQSQLAPKEGLVTVSWPAARLTLYSFGNPRETVTSETYAQPVDEMHQTHNACGRHRSAERARFSFVATLDRTLCNPRFKSWTNGAQVLPHPPYSPDLSPTSDQAFKHLNNLLQGMTLPQPGGGRKCFLRVHWIPKHRFLCYRNKQTYFSLTKTCW